MKYRALHFIGLGAAVFAASLLCASVIAWDALWGLHHIRVVVSFALFSANLMIFVRKMALRAYIRALSQACEKRRFHEKKRAFIIPAVAGALYAVGFFAMLFVNSPDWPKFFWLEYICLYPLVLQSMKLLYRTEDGLFYIDDVYGKIRPVLTATCRHKAGCQDLVIDLEIASNTTRYFYISIPVEDARRAEAWRGEPYIM
jgi:hypothetical protein